MHHRNDRLLVLGNGPSLRGLDLTRLGDTATLGMNAAYRHWERIGWYPDLYCCLDDQLTITHQENIRKLIDEGRCRAFFLLADMLQWHPELAANPRVYFLHSFFRTSCAQVREKHDIPCFESPFFARRAEDPITTGSFSVRFGAFLGFRRIGLLGIDCRYQNLIPEAVNTSGIVLEMEATPEHNPNYFFDDYQQKGDRYNIPNPDGDIHLLSFQQVREVLTPLGVEVVNLNPESALKDKDILPYVPLAEFQAGNDLSAVFVPVTSRERDRIKANFLLWDDPAAAPFAVLPDTPTIGLHFALNGDPDPAFEADIRQAFAATRSLDQVFAGPFFHYSGLRGLADGYSKDLDATPGALGHTSGPNNQFFDIINRFSQGQSHVFLMETDCRPIRPDWLRHLRDLVRAGDGFWICGSHYRGRGAPRHHAHINGNAIYAVGDPDFRHFLDTVYFPAFHRLLAGNAYLPYDIVLEELFRPVHRHEADPELLALWKRVAARFRYTDAVQDLSFWYDGLTPEPDPKALAAAYPEAFIVHGKQFFTDRPPTDFLVLDHTAGPAALTFDAFAHTRLVAPESELAWVFQNSDGADQQSQYVTFIFNGNGSRRLTAGLEIRLPTPGRVLVRLVRHGSGPFEEATREIAAGPGYTRVELAHVFAADHAQVRVQIHVLENGRQLVSVRNLSVRPALRLTDPEALANLAYSKKSHFRDLPPMPCYAGQDPAAADLKMCQDWLAHAVIRELLPPGSRILEVGGGNSRLAAALADDYDYWCLDKYEGRGNGPTEAVLPPGVRLVRDYLGNFSPELPSGAFDLVLSVSVLEHLPKDESVYAAILDDIARLLAPGGLSLHCVDALLKPGHDLTHPIVAWLASRLELAAPLAPLFAIAHDPDTYVMTRQSYEARWQRYTGQAYDEFGTPYSRNLLWRQADQTRRQNARTIFAPRRHEDLAFLDSLPLDELWDALPAIAMVIPSYNQARYLDRAITSLLGQGYPKLELRVLDGGSTDGSVEVVRRHESRLAGWRSRPDEGHYAAVAEGHGQTSGEIMGWLNADDMLHDGALFKIAAVFMAYPEIDWITGRPTVYDAAGDLTLVVDPLPAWTPTAMADMGVRQFLQQESTFWRRSLWQRAGGLRTDLALAGDYALWMEFFRHARLYTVDALLGGYRMHDANRGVTQRTAYLAEKSRINEEYAAFLADFAANAALTAPPAVAKADIALRLRIQAAARRAASQTPS